MVHISSVIPLVLVSLARIPEKLSEDYCPSVKHCAFFGEVCPDCKHKEALANEYNSQRRV